MIQFVFDQPFLEQIQFFQQKGYAISPHSWRDVWQAAHARAFTVAQVTQMDVLEDIRSELDKAMKSGMTLEEFKKNLGPVLEDKGWLAPKGEKAKVVLPDGEIRKRLTGWRLDTIYGTNLNAAYQVGRYKQQVELKDRRHYWMYRAVMDGSTRPEHAAMNGKIYPADSPEWRYIYPPNGFRCRCYVRTVSEREMKRDNLSVETEKPDMTPDDGWNFNPGQAGLDAWKPDLKRYSPEALKILKPALTGAAVAGETARKEAHNAILEYGKSRRARITYNNAIFENNIIDSAYNGISEIPNLPFPKLREVARRIHISSAGTKQSLTDSIIAHYEKNRKLIAELDNIIPENMKAKI